MILHCTLPYRQDIPNPALGYLKGFLQSKGIPVKNVYWNLVLARTVMDFHRNVERYSTETGLTSFDAITLFLCKHLLSENREPAKTTLDVIFASVFKKEEIQEMVASMKTEIDQYILQNSLHEAPLAGFTLKTYQWPMSYYLTKRLKEMNPDIRIVMGGIADESQAAAFMRIFDQADFAIWGEGEYPLYSLHKALEEDTALEKVPNLIYREDGTLNATRAPVDYPPLDSYPFADHSDYFHVKKKFAPLGKSPMVPIWGSRACPWNRCKFCALNENYTYRTRSPENIVQEIEFQSKKYHVDEFFFMDTDVAGTKKRFVRLLDLLMQSIRERRRPYRLYGEISPLFIDAETAPSIKRAGFVMLQVGFEAVTDRLLEKMRKRHGFIYNIRLLKLGTRHDLPLVSLNIIRGTPPETENDILESRINLRLLRFYLQKYYLEPVTFVLYRGSPFYEEMSENERKEWRKDSLWEEAASFDIVPESERFQFFGFITEEFTHFYTWESFENALKFYRERPCSYEWREGPDGSTIEETGIKPYKYTLNRDETDLLVFCDSIRTFSEVQKEFPHMSEETLYKTMDNLREEGFLYFDKKKRILSIVDATQRKLPPS